MEPTSDLWYVRLPDGREYRAKNTEAVRRHVLAGDIPRESFVRRSPDEDWSSLEWVSEFSALYSEPQDAVPAPAPRPAPAPAPPPRRPLSAYEMGVVGARLDSDDLQTVGVRSILTELLAALDCALVPGKIITLVVVMLLMGLTLAGALQLILAFPEIENHPWLWYSIFVATGLVGLALWSCGTVILVQLTYLEVSHVRRIRWRRGTDRLGALSFKLWLAGVFVLGPIALFWWLSLQARGAVAEMSPLADEIVCVLAWGLRVLLALLLGFSALLPPLVILEENSAFRAVGQWWQLVRRHFTRVFLFESLAIALGILAILLFGLAVEAAGSIFASGQKTLLAPYVAWWPAVLLAAPLAAILIVANVFIYLNLRYELPRRRQSQPHKAD